MSHLCKSPNWVWICIYPRNVVCCRQRHLLEYGTRWVKSRTEMMTSRTHFFSDNSLLMREDSGSQKNRTKFYQSIILGMVTSNKECKHIDCATHRLCHLQTPCLYIRFMPNLRACYIYTGLRAKMLYISAVKWVTEYH